MVTPDYIHTTRRAVRCPYCGKSKPAKWGRTKDANQRYRCGGCKKTFLHTGALAGHRAPTGQIGAAIRMFYGGTSYKQTGETLAEAYNIPEPSKATLYEWVDKYTDHAKDVVADHPAHTTGKWVADEMQVRVGGEMMWNWNVMDASSRYILASHLSPNRDQRAAIAVMRKAMAASDGPPKSITTDKLGSYVPAIKAVFPDADHIQSEGIRAELNNNLSERLQGSFRQREKTLRGMDSLESGQRYLDGWVMNYNLFREHEGVDYQTPAEMAGVSTPFKEWEDVVKDAAVNGRRQSSVLTPTLADVADRADRHGEQTAPPTTHFVRDPTLRRRPKGETESDDPDEYPLSRRSPLPLRRSKVRTGWQLPPR